MVFPSCSTVRIFYITENKHKISSIQLPKNKKLKSKPKGGKMISYKVNPNGAYVTLEIWIILD